MAKERENFGFYFSAHPVQQFWTKASANGARTYQSLMEAGAPPGGRSLAVMAAMVEDVSKARTRKGGEFVRATFSDPSGQFSAACFEEGLVSQFEDWAQEGKCLLLNVELDAPNPNEPPRVTVRGARALEDVSTGSRMLLQLDVSSVEALIDLKLELATSDAADGEVIIRLVIYEDQQALMRLGRNFELDGELAERLSSIEGISNVELQPLRVPGRGKANLRLVA